MKEKPKPFDQLLSPYLFILKEGKEIRQDFLNYSLLLLQVSLADVLPSPGKKQKTSTPTIQLLKK